MKATSAALGELARAAGVRSTIIYHCWAYRKEMSGKATPQGYASFTDLPLHHAERVFAVLDEQNTPAPRKARQRTAPHGLAIDFVIPEEWIALGRSRRFWTDDVSRTEADRFVNWHRMKGSMWADWRAAWINWIDRSNRENGKVAEVSGLFSDSEAQKAYLAKLAQ